MKNDYCFDTLFNKIKLTPVTRMLLVFGEGELGIKNQGRFWNSFSFSQETGAIGQQKPRIGDERPKLERELSAWMHVDSNSTPHFFSSHNLGIS
ncbi:MAG: hypothetical protein BroJett040_04450 [Oligoflexia bacterium]|nr:MAG: hypothetical protein BroJett040_04450 [Oligoflexia bacterium]